MLKCGILVLNFNRPSETLRCVKSVNVALSKAKFLNCKKLVIDNGSNRERRLQLTEFLLPFPEWEILNLDSNLGFAAGMNKGIQHFSRLAFDHFILLNNDVTLHEACLEKLYTHLCYNASEIIVGCSIVNTATKETMALGGHFYYPWLGVSRPNLASAQVLNSEKKTLSYIDGAAFAIKSEYLRSVGGIPERNFMYFEELFLAKPLKKRLQLGFCESALIFHQGSLTASEELDAHAKHYLALKACLDYTLDQNWLMLPSVIIVRLSWLLIQSIRINSFGPLSAGFFAVSEFVSNLLSRR